MAEKAVKIEDVPDDAVVAKTPQKSEGENKPNSLEHLGIPRAEFMSDIEATLKRNGDSAEEAIVKLKELHSKYSLMEESLTIRREGLKQRIPSIRRNLEMVQFLEEQAKSEDSEDGELKTSFELSAGLWTSATVKKTDKVLIMLGANILMEYSTGEALELLTTNLKEAEDALTQMDEDLGYLKDQKTTTEVNMNRTFNWDVRMRRKAKQAEAAAKATTTADDLD